MTTPLVPVSRITTPTSLAATQFQALAEIPPEIEWFANLRNANTRSAYCQGIEDFLDFAGLHQRNQFRDVTRAHVITLWDQLVRQGLANDTILGKLAALSSLYAYLCERHAVWHNPVLGVKRPRSMNREGVRPALGDHQAPMLLHAPPADTLKGKRDRAILATQLYHALRCEEFCTLKVGDIHQREDVPSLRVEGKGDKVRYLPLQVLAQRLITAHLDASGHAGALHSPLFRPVKNNRTKTLAKPLHPASVYQDIAKHYARELGLTDVVPGLCVHFLRTTAATNAMPMRPTSPKCRSGWGIRIFPRHGCTASARTARKIAQRLRSGIEMPYYSKHEGSCVPHLVKGTR